MHRFSRLCAATLVAAAAALTLGAGSAQAVYIECPEGWVEMDQQVGEALQFCGQPWDPPGAPDAVWVRYVIKAKAWNVSQAYELDREEDDVFPPPIPSPEFSKQPVRDWAHDLVAARRASTVINGGYFTSTTGTWKTEMSFPFATQMNSSPTTALQTVGQDPTRDALWGFLRCISWDRAHGSVVNVGDWTLPSNDFRLVVPEVSGGPCPTGRDGEFMVGSDPDYESSGAGQPEVINMVGRSMTGRLPKWDTLCFFVGGWQTYPDAQQILRDFGCEPVMSLDSGRSTSLSFVHSGAVTSQIAGYAPSTHRWVPHVVTIK